MSSLLSNISMACKMLSSSINCLFQKQITNHSAQFRRAVYRPLHVSSLNMVAEKSDTAHLEALSQAVNNVGIHLYKKLATEKGNVFISPPSLSSALAMAFCGARGETALEMRQILGYNVAGIKNENVRRCFQLLLSSLNNTRRNESRNFRMRKKSFTLNCSNVVLGQHELPFKEDFKTNLEESFNAMVQNVDFGDSEKAVQQVNDWVNEKTNGMISKFIDHLDPMSLLIILNAVYFKGFWKNEFEKYNTKKSDFYNEGSESSVREVDMMYVKRDFLFTQNKSYRAIELPYVGEEISMLVLLPNDRNGLEALENELPSDFLKELETKLELVKVNLRLPKFRLEYSKSLKEQFRSMGMNLAFSEDACFDGMSELSGFFIGDIIHKAVVIVDEKGTEAAAATGEIMCGSARFPPVTYDFHADHPFLFLIYNKETDLILFMGRISKL